MTATAAMLAVLLIFTLFSDCPAPKKDQNVSTYSSFLLTIFPVAVPIQIAIRIELKIIIIGQMMIAGMAKTQHQDYG